MDINLISEELKSLDQKQVKVSPEEVVEEVMESRKNLILNPNDINIKELKFLKSPQSKVTNMTKLIGDLLPIKCGYTSDNRFFVTPYGGPTITEGEDVPNNSRFSIIKIHYSPDSEVYLVELKDKVK